MAKYLKFLFCISSVFWSCNDSLVIESNEAVILLDNEDYYFLDVRSLKEHKTVSIPNTDCIPLQEIDQRIEELDKYRNKKIIVYCRSGNRSGTATDILNRNGFNAYNMIGGINEWEGEIISEE